jgi:hypothetical protein
LEKYSNSISYLKENQDKIDWDYLSINPSIFKEIKSNNFEIIKKTIEIILT